MSALLHGSVFGAGVAAYLFYFKHNEHHLHPTRYIKSFCLALSTLAITNHQKANVAWAPAIKSSLSLGFLFLAGAILSVTIYRLFFNPLNSVPGPYFARLTRFNSVLRVAKLDGHHQWNRLHRKHGKFLRTGPNDISVTHPDGVQVTSGLHSKCIKGTWYDINYPEISLHDVRDKATHDRRKRTWAPAFSDKALRGYETRIQVYNDMLIQRIRSNGDKPLNMSLWFNRYSFDVMGDLGFGSSFDMLASGKHHWAIKILNEGMDPLGFGFPTWFFRTIVCIPGLAAGYTKFVAYCNQRIDERVERQGKEEVKDIAHYLIDDYQKADAADKTMALHALHADSRLIIAAGSDTAAAALTYLFYHFARDESIVQRLREELDEKLGGEEITHLKIQDAPFLNGCINEAMRLNPPVPSGFPRKTPKEGVMIGGTFIPGDTTTFMPAYVMGHDEANFPSAEKFIPERWYSKPDLVVHKDAFQPFSSGPYGCIGKNLALMEIRLLAVQLISLFDVAFAPGETGTNLLEKSTDHFTLGLQPLELVFLARQ